MAAQPHSNLPARKRILFSLFPAALFVLLLVVAELALRVFDRSLDVPFLLEVRYGGSTWLQVNRRYLEKYFPAGTLLLPELKPNIMRKEKTASVFRVVCFGESSMFGVPYQMTANIPGILRMQLRHLMPDREIEVVNLGASAVNSNVLADMAPMVASLKPDVVLLYCGHNEFYGPDAAGASFLERVFPSLTRLKYHLRDLRLVRLFQRLLHQTLVRQGAGSDQNLMQEVSAGAHVHPGSATERRVFAMTKRNFTTMIDVFRDSGIPLIISDVSSNLLFPPFAYDGATGFPAIAAAEQTGHDSECLSRAGAALAGDSTNAFLQFWAGKACDGLGDTDLALAHLQHANDFDLLRFRAPHQTNAIIASLCREERVPFVSADSVFRANSVHGIPGPDLFWEHVHPKIRGYYLIANLYLREMMALNLLPEQPVRSDLLPPDPDSLDICWLDQAYGDLSVYAITSRWPFNNYQVSPAVLGSADAELRQTVVEVYNKKLSWEEGCLKSANAFLRRDSLPPALTTYRAMIDEFPLDYYPHYLAAVVLKQESRTTDAMKEYETSIALNPAYPNARIDLALLEINAGRFDGAIRQLDTTSTLLTDQTVSPLIKATIAYGLAAAYANKGDYGRATEYINQSVRLSPSYAAAQELRLRLMNRR